MLPPVFLAIVFENNEFSITIKAPKYSKSINMPDP